MELTFTGEYVVPGKTPERIEADHRARYHWAGKFVRGKEVLDIACGTGYGSEILRTRTAGSVEGVDVNGDLIDWAIEHYTSREFEGRGNLRFLRGDILDWCPPYRYDVVVCFETIEHIQGVVEALENLYSLLYENGILLLSSPHKRVISPKGKNNRFHVQEFNIRQLVDLVEDVGLGVIGIWGQEGFPLSKVVRVTKENRDRIRYFILEAEREKEE